MWFGNEDKVEIHFIRHGQTKANEEKLFCGFTDIELSEIGRKELQNLKKLGNYPKGQVYINSGLKRCIQTMNLLYDNPEYHIIEKLKEINFGKFEMKHYEGIKSDLEYQNWILDIEHKCPPNGESREIFRKRIKEGFLQVLSICRKNQAESAVVVSHGGVIAVLMENLFEEEKHFYEWQPENGRGYTVLLKGNQDLEYKKI